MITEGKAITSTQDDTAGNHRISSEHELMRAVLNLAIRDAGKSGKVGKEARDYLFGNASTEYIYSFENICEHLDVCADFIRKIVVTELAKED